MEEVKELSKDVRNMPENVFFKESFRVGFQETTCEVDDYIDLKPVHLQSLKRRANKTRIFRNAELKKSVVG